MTRLTCVLAVAVLSAVPMAALGQAAPTITGTWVLLREPGAPPDPPPPPPPSPPAAPSGVDPNMPPPPPSPPPPPPPALMAVAVDQTATELHLQQTLQEGDRTALRRFRYALDGSVTANHMGPFLLRSTLSRDAGLIVIAHTYSLDGQSMGHGKESYRLEGERLIVEEERLVKGVPFRHSRTFVRP